MEQVRDCWIDFFGVEIMKNQRLIGILTLQGKPADHLSKKSLTGTWNNIAQVKSHLLKVGLQLSHILKKKVGSGEHTLF